MFRALLLLAILLVNVSADMYLHNPPGSNDRNRERNQNRNNANLLYDSQNNAQGGYPWRGNASIRASPDPLVYYAGSTLNLEWTNQHACGPNPNNYCTVIIQFGSDNGLGANASSSNLPGMRDGYPDSPLSELTQSDNNNPGYTRLPFSTNTCTGSDCTTQNQDGTNRIPSEGFRTNAAQRIAFYYGGQSGGVQFPMHEGPDYHDECVQTNRNQGLYTADQSLNGNNAAFTRQNPNGARYGLECQEERDYYPYWRYTPWTDVAVLTSMPSLCSYYQQNSQNVQPVYFCNCGQATRDGNNTVKCTLGNNQNVIPINSQGCAQVGGSWQLDTRTVKNLAMPDCQYHPFGRDNHLGNVLPVTTAGQLQVDPAGEPVAAHYAWTVPSSLIGQTVALRLRYNISTGDYPPYNYALNNVTFFDASNNCPFGGVQTADGANVDDLQVSTGGGCNSDTYLDNNNTPLYNRPYVGVYGASINLSIALNTHQSGRTFQDRSYVFTVQAAPSYVSGNIVNLNVRGRRGNIVQCYPAVEYDFTPQRLTMTQGDWIHIQIHGSDFNNANNANDGEGWQFSDRSNIVQTIGASSNFPIPQSKLTMFTPAAATFWALLNQGPNCTNFQSGQTNEQNSYHNCGKLNQAPNRFPQDPTQGLVQVSVGSGTYYYLSTRSNNFSNRSTKGMLIVNPSSSTSTATIVAAVFGSVAGVALIFGGVLVYGKRNQNSCAGPLYNSVANCGPKKSVATTGPDMEYQRHAVTSNSTLTGATTTNAK